MDWLGWAGVLFLGLVRGRGLREIKTRASERGEITLILIARKPCRDLKSFVYALRVLVHNVVSCPHHHLNRSKTLTKSRKQTQDKPSTPSAFPSLPP